MDNDSEELVEILLQDLLNGELLMSTPEGTSQVKPELDDIYRPEGVLAEKLSEKVLREMGADSQRAQNPPHSDAVGTGPDVHDLKIPVFRDGADQSGAAHSGQLPAGKEPQAPSSTNRRKATRQNERSKEIDEALRRIDESYPKSQKEIFLTLENGRVPIPRAEPFKSAGR